MVLEPPRRMPKSLGSGYRRPFQPGRSAVRSGDYKRCPTTQGSPWRIGSDHSATSGDGKSSPLNRESCGGAPRVDEISFAAGIAALGRLTPALTFRNASPVSGGQ